MGFRESFRMLFCFLFLTYGPVWPWKIDFAPTTATTTTSDSNNNSSMGSNLAESFVLRDFCLCPELMGSRISRESIEVDFRHGGTHVLCSTILCSIPAPIVPPRLRKCSALRPLFPPRWGKSCRHLGSQTHSPTVWPQFVSAPPPTRVVSLAGTAHSRLDLLPYAQHNDAPHLGVSRSQQKREKREAKNKRKEKREHEKGEGAQAWFRSFIDSILWSFATSICASCWWCFTEDMPAGGLFFLFRLIVFRICMLLRFILFRVCSLLGLITLATSTQICAQYCALKSSVQIGLQDEINSYVMVCLWSTHTSMRDFSLRIGGIAAHRILWFLKCPMRICIIWFLKFRMRICISVLGTFSVCRFVERRSLWFTGAQIVSAHLYECPCWACSSDRPRSEEQCSVDPDYWSSLGNVSVIPPKKIVFDTHYRSIRMPGTNRRILMRTRPKSPTLEFMPPPPRGFFMPSEIIVETLPRGAAKSVHRILRAQKRRFVQYWVPAPASVCQLQCVRCVVYQGVRVEYEGVVSTMETMISSDSNPTVVSCVCCL